MPCGQALVYFHSLLLTFYDCISPNELHFQEVTANKTLHPSLISAFVILADCVLFITQVHLCVWATWVSIVMCCQQLDWCRAEEDTVHVRSTAAALLRVAGFMLIFIISDECSYTTQGKHLFPVPEIKYFYSSTVLKYNLLEYLLYASTQHVRGKHCTLWFTL